MKIKLLKEQIDSIKKKALYWADSRSNVLCYLDNNHYQEEKYSRYECLIAVGVEKELRVKEAGTGFEELKLFARAQKKWLFGQLAYDLKNEVETLKSNNKDGLSFPELYFFVPKYVLLFHKNEVLEIIGDKEEIIWNEINQVYIEGGKVDLGSMNLQQAISKEEYIRTIKKIKAHIIDGDVYEMNFCQEFFVENTKVNPIHLFSSMNEIAKAPFSAYFKNKALHLLCGSPERFMYKSGRELVSQPIKGTIKRGKSREEDALLKTALFNSEKDRAENVMIVDLVRNDMSKTCEVGSIKVEELFGIYGFEKVFQMISTIKGKLKEKKHWVDAIKEAFPMGSMTGAPKVMSMELIESYEKTKRGLYSGSIGYVSPEGDFDFNVVIRSILYNSIQKYLSFQVGGAIVYDSDPEAEYEECLLKAKTMLETLGIDV